MARKIYIISKITEITQEVIREATNESCFEIVKGIPPILKAKLRGKKLPLVYEEPEQTIPEPKRDYGIEIDELNVKVDSLLLEKETRL